MICKKCGKYNSDNNKVCIYCGGALEQGQKDNKSESFYQSSAWKQQPQQQYESVESKKVEGVVFCLFLGAIGLILGLIIYSDSHDRSTFTSGWLLTFVMSIVSALIIFCAVSCLGYI